MAEDALGKTVKELKRERTTAKSSFTRQANFIDKREQAINDFVNKKMNRLEKFYKYGLSQAGWNKYSYINIEFDNQIICKKHKNS